MNLSPAQLLAALRTSGFSLPTWGKVHDQATSQFVQYSADRLTYVLQQSVLAYLDNPPRDEEGMTKFLTVLAGRQVGKSLVVEYGLYPHVAYNPGWDHVCIADNRARADYLHKRVHNLHEFWDEQVRAPTIKVRESRQLTFDNAFGGKMRVLSAEDGNVGIGQSPDSFHASECAFWPDFSDAMFKINPSIRNRANARVVFECTPWLVGDDWHDHCIEAKAGTGRHTYLFCPFWDGKLNRRKWPKDWALENDEIRLLEKYGPFGLRKEHLAFRRSVMRDDDEIRKYPEKFAVFYPFDDISCWLSNSICVIPESHLLRHLDTVARYTEIKGDFRIYDSPDPRGRYVIGVDPCGHAMRDHASFQVLEVLEDSVDQVAVFSGNTDPNVFARLLFDTGVKYNMAEIAIESNGVGQGIITLLKEWGYPKLVYEAQGKPGLTTTAKSLDKMLSHLVTDLEKRLYLRDHVTVTQLRGYKNDKRIEESAQLELIRGAPNKRRRERHHWDAVSALLIANEVSRTVGYGRRDKFLIRPSEATQFSGDITYSQLQRRLLQDRTQAKKGERDRRFKEALGHAD